jgi:hypothetical protein
MPANIAHVINESKVFLIIFFSTSIYGPKGILARF